MSQRTYFNALILLVILINSEAISLSEKIKQGRADIPTKQSDLHKINDEILFLETSAETKTMSTAELYTAELAQITEILKLGFGQIDHSLAKHVKKLRTVADGKILSREELHDHRKDIIAFVQKALHDIGTTIEGNEGAKDGEECHSEENQQGIVGTCVKDIDSKRIPQINKDCSGTLVCCIIAE